MENDDETYNNVNKILTYITRVIKSISRNLLFMAHTHNAS